MLSYKVIFVKIKFSAPSIEAKIEQDGFLIFENGDGPMITGPCIVRVRMNKSDS